ALRHRQLHVCGSGREIDDEIVKLTPVDVEQKLPYRAGEHRPAPDCRLVGLDEERNGNDLDAVALDGNDLFVLCVRLFVLRPQQNGHVRPVDVGVQDTGSGAKLGEGERKIDGAGGLSDATLPGANRHDVLDALQLLLL